MFRLPAFAQPPSGAPLDVRRIAAVSDREVRELLAAAQRAQQLLAKRSRDSLPRQMWRQGRTLLAQIRRCAATLPSGGPVKDLREAVLHYQQFVHVVAKLAYERSRSPSAISALQ